MIAVSRAFLGQESSSDDDDDDDDDDDVGSCCVAWFSAVLGLDRDACR